MNRDPLESMSPEAWRALLPGYIKDLNRIERAYLAVELLVKPAGEGDKDNDLGDLPRSYLYALLTVLNNALSETQFEVWQAFEKGMK
jgi:hypothetical protein